MATKYTTMGTPLESELCTDRPDSTDSQYERTRASRQRPATQATSQAGARSVIFGIGEWLHQNRMQFRFLSRFAVELLTVADAGPVRDYCCRVTGSLLWFLSGIAKYSISQEQTKGATPSSIATCCLLATLALRIMSVWGLATEIELQKLAQEPCRKLDITQTQSPETH